MNNIIKQLETNEYSESDYLKIINLCNNKILNIEYKKINQIFLNNVKNITIKNEVLKFFFETINSSLKCHIEKTNSDDIKSISISFNYTNYSIDLVIYYDEDDSVFTEEKIIIINNLTHSYETYYTNCEEKLLNILDLKSVSNIELSNLIKNLFEQIPYKIV
jgi:hypothetical protein